MAQMKVKLTEYMALEEHGLPAHHAPGDIVEVGKQLARRWLASGQAVREWEEIPPTPEPRVNVAGRYTKLG